MPPIETTLDILYLALAGAVLLLAIFLAWALYFLIMSLKDVRSMTRDVRSRLEAFWEVIELLREKLQVGGAVFKLAATGIKELAEHMRSYTESEGSGKKKKKKAE